MAALTSSLRGPQSLSQGHRQAILAHRTQLELSFCVCSGRRGRKPKPNFGTLVREKCRVWRAAIENNSVPLTCPLPAADECTCMSAEGGCIRDFVSVACWRGAKGGARRTEQVLAAV